MSPAIKLERFEARISAEDKRTLERAAELSGRKLTVDSLSTLRTKVRDWENTC